MTLLHVSATVSVSATPARVWRALTDPVELLQWYAPGCRWEIPHLALGAPIRFFNTETDIQPATVVALVPERCLALRWQPDPALPTATLRTTYEIVPEVDGATVTLVHTEYESIPPDQRAAWLDADTGAVPAILAALQQHVATKHA